MFFRRTFSFPEIQIAWLLLLVFYLSSCYNETKVLHRNNFIYLLTMTYISNNRRTNRRGLWSNQSGNTYLYRRYCSKGSWKTCWSEWSRGGLLYFLHSGLSAWVCCRKLVLLQKGTYCVLLSFSWNILTVFNSGVKKRIKGIVMNRLEVEHGFTYLQFCIVYDFVTFKDGFGYLQGNIFWFWILIWWLQSGAGNPSATKWKIWR